MNGNVICLAGSMRYYDFMKEVEEKLSRDKYVVLKPSKDPRDKTTIPKDERREYEILQQQRIDMADILYVINVEGYIGPDTMKEIEYAKSHNKVVLHMFPDPEQWEQEKHMFRSVYSTMRFIADVLGPDAIDNEVDSVYGRRTWPQIVTLCGSKRFMSEFLEIKRKLEMEGKIVLMPAIFDFDPESLTDKEHAIMDRLHRDKMDIADVVYIVNPEGYTGPNTRDEIDYAISKGLNIKYMVNPNREGQI